VKGSNDQLTASKPKPVGPLEITADVKCYFVSKFSEIVQGHLHGKATGSDGRLHLSSWSSANAFPDRAQYRPVATLGLAESDFVVNHSWLG